MTPPRPLTDPALLARVREADEAYARDGTTGQLVIEVHYGSGVPIKAKVRRESDVRLAKT